MLTSKGRLIWASCRRFHCIYLLADKGRRSVGMGQNNWSIHSCMWVWNCKHRHYKGARDKPYIFSIYFDNKYRGNYRYENILHMIGQQHWPWLMAKTMCWQFKNSVGDSVEWSLTFKKTISKFRRRGFEILFFCFY